MAEAIAEAYAEIGADLTGLDVGIAQVQAKLGSIQGVNLPVNIGGTAGTETATANFRQLGVVGPSALNRISASATQGDFNMRRLVMATSMASTGVMQLQTSVSQGVTQVAHAGVSVLAMFGGVIGVIAAGATMVVGQIITTTLTELKKLDEEIRILTESMWVRAVGEAKANMTSLAEISILPILDAMHRRQDVITDAETKLGASRTQLTGGSELQRVEEQARRMTEAAVEQETRANERRDLAQEAVTEARQQLANIQRDVGLAGLAGTSEQTMKSLYEQENAAEKLLFALEAIVRGFTAEAETAAKLTPIITEQAQVEIEIAQKKEATDRLVAWADRKRAERAEDLSIEQRTAAAKKQITDLEGKPKRPGEITEGAGSAWASMFTGMEKDNLEEALNKSKVTELLGEIRDIEKERGGRSGVFGT